MQYRIIGMDCARDAAEIESAARSVDAVRGVKVSVATQIMTIDLGGVPTGIAAVESAIGRLGYTIERVDRPGPDGPQRTAFTPRYRRALQLVVALNLGYGVIEMAGGFLSQSQALKADALDFLGDGLITLLGLVAIGWSLRWRARSALIQGVFLGALGIGVLVTTGYRVLVQRQPEADLMGMFGVVALLVNVAAAAALLPHRTGDSNVRAVWLFSRNDAIGNAAVVVAALLVAWTGTPWPDLVVAVVIAALFLHSAWSIVRDASADLATGSSHTSAHPS